LIGHANKTPWKAGSFEVAERSKGIPAKEIAYIHDAATDAQKEDFVGRRHSHVCPPWVIISMCREARDIEQREGRTSSARCSRLRKTLSSPEASFKKDKN
jgi:hypothetical protein